MTEKQKLFADEWLKDRNATRAYKVAYPNIKNDACARSAASRLLANVNVRAYVDTIIAEMHDAAVADAAEVMEYLTSVMRGEAESEVVVIEYQYGCSQARVITKTPDLKERLKAAVELGKAQGVYVEQQKAGNVAVNITFSDDLEDDLEEDEDEGEL